MKGLSLSILSSLFLTFLEPRVLGRDQPPRLISDASIAKQKENTKTFRLRNQVPVIYRYIPDSDLMHVSVGIRRGLKDFDMNDKAAWTVMLATMTEAAKGTSKEKVFETVEKYSLGIACSAGMEVSTCDFNSITDYFDQGLDLFVDLLKEPLLASEDIEKIRNQLAAAEKANHENPSRLSNDAVNSVFYNADHPYLTSTQQMFEAYKAIKPSQVRALHGRFTGAHDFAIVVVGSMKESELMKDLDRRFSFLKPNPKESQRFVPEPKFDRDNAAAFIEKEIPSAYMTIKFNFLGASNAKSAAALLMLKILDEELGDEIRTKRSLSYSVYSFGIQYSIGVGVIGATTSEPQKTLRAIIDVVKAMRDKTYSAAELDEHKRVYATNYFLTQEEHSSLAAALLNYYMFQGSTDALYDYPRKLDAVTPGDIKDLASELLRRMRVGVVYDREKFNDDWSKNFVKAFRK